MPHKDHAMRRVDGVCVRQMTSVSTFGFSSIVIAVGELLGIWVSLACGVLAAPIVFSATIICAVGIAPTASAESVAAPATPELHDLARTTACLFGFREGPEFMSTVGWWDGGAALLMDGASSPSLGVGFAR